MVFDVKKKSKNHQIKLVDEKLYDKYIKNNIVNTFRDPKPNQQEDYVNNASDFNFVIKKVTKVQKK